MAQRIASDQRSLNLRLICRRSPEIEGAEFGVQDRDQALHAGRERADGAVCFDVTVTVARRGADDAPRYGGPFVHGTAVTPFLYLGVRRHGAEPGTWVRRLKIPLPKLTWEQVTSYAGQGVLVARVSGEGSGTVPLEGGGWECQAG